MASLKRRTKVVAALAGLLLLGIFLPPNINGTRFQKQLTPALSAALGRKVTIGQIKYLLLPRPGFELYDFRVDDEPAFGAEPLLMCGKVTADLRLTSLWQGRLEIANLKLTDDALPPSLNLVYANGHWNLESLILRVGQVPSAPTAKRRAEQRPRFPYIEASGGRINIKVGPEKKPYTLANTDFALWLAAEDLWHVRLEGRPVRTDMNLSDTGTVKLEGDLQRSREVASMPVKLDVSWEKTQLGQFSRLVLGQDRGWRGDLQGSAQLVGTPANLHVTASAELSHFRRYDINRDSMPRLRTRCLGDAVHGVLDLRCDTPLEAGGLLFTTRWSVATPFDYDLSVVANHVPLSVVATFARQARRTLPDDLTATGDCNAAFGFHSHNGVRNWHGAGMTSPFVLQSSVAEKPFPVSSIKFHAGPADSSPPVAARKVRPATASPTAQSDSLTIDAFSIQLGPSTTLEVQGNLDYTGYRFSTRGMVPLERLLVLGKTTGFETGTTNFTASAVVNLDVNAPWGNSLSPRVEGTAHLQNLAAWIPGVKDRLLLAQADAQLTDAGLVLAHVNGQFEHAPVSFTGTITSPWSCADPAPCPLEFDLHSDTLAIADVAGLFSVNDKGWSLPFLSDSSSSSKLPQFRAKGNLSVDQLKAAQITLEKFSGHVEVGDQSLLVSHVAAKLGGGSATGEWHADWSGPQPHYTASGSFTGVALDHLGPQDPQTDEVTAWITGRSDAKYSFHFEGRTSQEMIASAAGRADVTVNAGSSRLLLLEASKPLKFQSFQGALELDKQTLKVLPGKFKAENRIYEISGTLTLADKQAKLRITNGGSRWEISGALEQPRIAAQPMAAQTTAAHPR
jgi:hypothetical protein